MNIEQHVNILNRLEQIENEVRELKKEIETDVDDKGWMPRPGEIVEVGDNREEWFVDRLVDYDESSDYAYKTTHDAAWRYCRPLNDPMVIQLTPHDPVGGKMPCDGDEDVLVMYGDGTYDHMPARELYWNDEDLTYDVQIIGWTKLPK